MTRDLTLLLPLNGRPIFTLRLLYHLDRMKLSFKLLIADGRVRDPIRQILQDAGNFPNLDYSYVCYPDDDSYSRFYEKMADATTRVTTKYVMLIDNDDFPFLGTLPESVDFLERSPDYVCSGFGVGGFSMEPGALQGAHGRITDLRYRYSSAYHDWDISAEEPWDRVQQGFTRSFISYYNVYRVESLEKIHNELRDLDFSDLEIHEAYFYLRAQTLGKNRSVNRLISYLRQDGTASQYLHRTDWALHLLRSSYTGDFAAMTQRIADIIEKAGQVSAEQARNWLTVTFARKLHADLQARFYADPPEIKRIKRLLAPIRYIRRKLARIRQPSASQMPVNIALLLKQNGADDASVAGFRAEMKAIEETLTGPGFPAFLQENAPSLLEGAWNR